MTFEFLILFGWLNLFFLNLEKREYIKKEIRLVKTKVIEIFQYKKNNDKY